MTNDSLIDLTFFDKGRRNFLIDIVPQIIATYEFQLQYNLTNKTPGAVFEAMNTALNKHILDRITVLPIDSTMGDAAIRKDAGLDNGSILSSFNKPLTSSTTDSPDEVERVARALCWHYANTECHTGKHPCPEGCKAYMRDYGDVAKAAIAAMRGEIMLLMIHGFITAFIASIVLYSSDGHITLLNVLSAFLVVVFIGSSLFGHSWWGVK